MSGSMWRSRARALVDAGIHHQLVDEGDREALIATAEAAIPYEPYYTIKCLIVRLESECPAT